MRILGTVIQKLMVSQDIIVLVTTSGYIVTHQQSLLVMITSRHVLVWEEDGEELLILISVQEMIVRVSGRKGHNLVSASVEWPVMIDSHVPLPISLLME